MRKYVLFMVMMAIGVVSFGQRSECKGYIGFTINGAIPTGDFADFSDNNSDAGYASTGAKVGFINFGYKLSSKYGIAASLFSSAHMYDNREDYHWGYGALMVGPMVSYPVARNLELEFKGMLGFGNAFFEDRHGEVEDGIVGFDFASTLRYNFARKWALLINADYFSTQAEFKDYTQSISALNVGLGLAFRLR
eukprot:TRINITY_DN5894_c0_g1_i1.p2 TRINITY_DN5894_c0_g1~~TRINITY_DN5894_c0_g1_i1.p2  ORF type:complete len:193 (-),score=39.04 TRINITY_DN5894_c0_g1_i1:1180-1758(-)